jgi:hypothetical protein
LPETYGLVQCLKVGDGFGFTTLVAPQGFVGLTFVNEHEHFILWWNGVSTPSQPDTSTRMKHDQWVSLLREAMANDISVRLSHPKDSAIVTSVQIGGPLRRTAVE